MLEFNVEQLKAVIHNKGPAMILAGPGSGKTTVIVGRIRHLILSCGVNPSSILVITYTKAAALSMQQRFIREMKGEILPVVFGTFHAIFFQIIKEYSNFSSDSLLTNREKYQIIKSLIKNQDVNTELAEQLLTCISLLKNGFSISHLPIPITMQQADFESFYQSYCNHCERVGKIDFDDILLQCNELLDTSIDVLKRWQKHFTYILVDEFQDSNVIQYEIVKKLALPENNLFVVGDDDQSIYGFRGASPGIMQRFLRDYTDAKKITLHINYRSRSEIVQVSNQIITKNRNRIHKEITSGIIVDRYTKIKAVTVTGFPDSQMEASYMIKRLVEFYKWFPYEEMAVIFRTNKETELFSTILEKHHIPYQFLTGNRANPNHFIIGDIIAFLQLALGYWERRYVLSIMNKPDRELSRIYFLSEIVDMTKTEALMRKNGDRKQADAVKLLYDQIKALHKLSPFLALNMILNGMGYQKWLIMITSDNRNLFENYRKFLSELMDAAKEFHKIEDFLTYLLKVIENKKWNQYRKQEGVALLTMHACKGLEFSYVCLPNVNEGNIPYGKMPEQDVIEEERRLFYVGITRAKTALDILYIKNSKEHPRLPSQFLKPLIERSYSVSSDSSTSSSNS